MRVSLIPRLLGLLVALGLGIYYIGFVILGYHVGSQTYTVNVQVSKAAGLFDGSSVTYRGVQVGTVEDIAVGPGGVDVTLEIQHEYDEIPADSYANIRMLSALGEQYVDFAPEPPTVPTTDREIARAAAESGVTEKPALAGSHLRDGSTIPLSRTTTPIRIGEVLNSGKRFLESVDVDDLHTLVNLLDNAFSDAGPQLRRIVNTGQDLTEALIAAESGTRRIIKDGSTVLDAANNTSDELETYVTAFDKLSKRFAKSDADLEQLFTSGGPALTRIEDLVNNMSGPFERLMDGAGAAGSAIAENSAAVQNLFAVLPDATEKLASVGDGDQLTGALRLNHGQAICSYTGKLPLPGVDHESGSPMNCDTGNGAQMRGPQHAPAGN